MPFLVLSQEKSSKPTFLLSFLHRKNFTSRGRLNCDERRNMHEGYIILERTGKQNSALLHPLLCFLRMEDHLQSRIGDNNDNYEPYEIVVQIHFVFSSCFSPIVGRNLCFFGSYPSGFTPELFLKSFGFS